MTYQALSVSDNIKTEPEQQQYVSFTDAEEAKRYHEMMGDSPVLNFSDLTEDNFDDFDAQGLSDLRG